MPYVQTSWVNATTPVNATNMNHLETQYLEATLSIEPLVLTPMVFNGLAATKDGTTANQLDVAAGNAFLLQADGTLRQRGPGSQQTFTTSTINTTYNLYIQPDGTFYWSTSNAPAANSLAIATVTTDGSGNIKTVTDARPTASTFLNGMLGTLTMPPMSVTATTTPAQLGTPVGGVTFGGAAFVQGDSSAASATFDGTSGYLSGPTTGLPTGNASWSLECLVKIAANPASSRVFIAMGTQSAKADGRILISSTGTITADVFGSATGASGAISLNTVHHLVATWNGTTLTCYVDGVSVGTSTPGALALAYGQVSVGGDFSVGAWADFAPASIAEAAFYGTALSSARVTAHFLAIVAGGYKAAVAADSPLRYYRLNEPSGASWVNSFVPSTVATTAADASANLGRVASLGGQTAAGTLGAPVIVAQALHVPVAAPAAPNILVYTPTITGLYRVSAFAHKANTSATRPIFQVSYQDPDQGTQQTAYVNSQTTGVVQPLDGSSGNAVTNIGLICEPLVMYASTTGSISVSYQDPSGTGTSYVSAVVERLG